MGSRRRRGDDVDGSRTRVSQVFIAGLACHAPATNIAYAMGITLAIFALDWLWCAFFLTYPRPSGIRGSWLRASLLVLLITPPGSLARRPPPRRAQSTAGRLPTPRRAPHSVAQAYRRTTTTFDGRDRRPQKQARNRRRDRRRRLVAHYRTTRRIEPMLSEQPVKDAPPAGPAPVNDECPCFQTLCCENVECCQPICRQLDGSWCCVVCVGCGSCLVWIGSIFM